MRHQKQPTAITDKQAAIEEALLRSRPRKKKIQMFRACKRSRGTFYPWLKGTKASRPLDRWAERYLGLPHLFFARYDEHGMTKKDDVDE